MCGLVGMAGSLTNNHRAVLKDLLFFDTLRGRDSTGLAVVKRNRDVTLKKSTVPGFEFIEHPAFDNWAGGGDQIWMGHNRYKTVGNASRANAHPFEVVDAEGFISFVGAHNGTLTNKFDIEKLIDGNERFGTDSEAFMNLIAQEGVVDAVAEAQGAWSLTVWEAPENVLHFIRNKERPMFVAFSEDRKVVMWASETWMILAAARRNGMELESKDGKGPILQTSEDTLYTLEIPQVMGTPFGDFKRLGGVQGKPERKFHPGYGSSQKFWYDLADSKDDAVIGGGSKSEATTQTPKKEPASEQSDKVVYIGGPPLVGFNGQSITREELAAAKKLGCVWCGSDTVQTHKPIFLGEKELLCYGCLNGSDDRRNFLISDRDKAKLEDAGKVRTILDEFKARVKGK